MQGNGETEKPKQHTDEEAVGSRWCKPEQQLGMSFDTIGNRKVLPGVDNPFGRRMVRHYDRQKIGHHLKSGRGVVRRGLG